jgi:hypothetical protein
MPLSIANEPVLPCPPPDRTTRHGKYAEFLDPVRSFYLHIGAIRIVVKGGRASPSDAAAPQHFYLSLTAVTYHS